ncbi:MAG: hypothetical protein K8F91_04140 [Candidatus Obscuribacterales bacterium]|nr:hypothetical protein [Candidatus Obscuribacterales bacterium]
MKLEKAAVIGAGAMGAGIAQVLSQAGMQVVLKDVKEEYVERGLKNIERMYESRVKKGALTKEQAATHLACLKGTVSYDDIKDPDIVIEAALEEIDIKLEIFKKLDSICPDKTLLATNTSALSISEIAAVTKRQDRVLGMHFFNPAQFMKLVEVIPGVMTSDKTIETAMSLCAKSLGKTPVRVKECPGFLVNRVLFPYMNEALYALSDLCKLDSSPAAIAAAVNEIDNKVVEFGLPMGPFTLFDMTGIDVCSHVVDFLYLEYGPRFEPSPLLKLMVENGQLGQKSGAGFYLHGADKPKEGEPKKVNPMLEQLLARIEKAASKAHAKDFDAMRVILPMFNEAIYALQEDVVKPEDVDIAMQFGCGMKNGLLTIAGDRGLDWCLSELSSYQALAMERFRPSWLLKKLVRARVHDFSRKRKEPAGVR